MKIVSMFKIAERSAPFSAHLNLATNPKSTWLTGKTFHTFMICSVKRFTWQG